MAGMILVKNLVDMGFQQEQAQIAVAATDCAGVQPAIEWLLKNGSDENVKPSTSAAAKSRKHGELEIVDLVQKKNPTESSVVTKRLLVDEAWELIDPTPDIHVLFVSFSKEFFWDKLGGVEVKWSPRMTQCAGMCSFKPRSRECIISLSQPLLSLRPRKDLVETLLHEMIHAFLFLDSGTTDREGHGEQFHHHMYRINKKSGTKITVYHSFNDEVHHYRTHWWKCDGPCQRKPPYFGIVKRAMNRAPGPSDYWHEQHKRECGGNYVKIREPEDYEKKKANKAIKDPGSSKVNHTILSPIPENSRKITDFFPASPKKSTTSSGNVPTSFISNPGPSAAGSSRSSSSNYVFPGTGRKLNEDSKSGDQTKRKKP